jgi:arylsulfatase
VIFKGQKKFTYYAPGAIRIAEKASAPVKGQSHTIVTKVDLKGIEEGVIVACGGMTGGYTMFLKGGRLYFDYNFLDGVYYTLESPPLEEGPTEFKFKFTATKMFGGRGELFVNGKKVDEKDMPEMHRSTYSLAETFDIGIDTGTQVSKLYKGPNKFTGELDKVVITLTD